MAFSFFCTTHLFDPKEKEFSVVLVLGSPLQTNDATILFPAADGEHGRCPTQGRLGTEPGAPCGCQQGPQSPGRSRGGVPFPNRSLLPAPVMGAVGSCSGQLCPRTGVTSISTLLVEMRTFILLPLSQIHLASLWPLPSAVGPPAFLSSALIITPVFSCNAVLQSLIDLKGLGCVFCTLSLGDDGQL